MFVIFYRMFRNGKLCERVENDKLGTCTHKAQDILSGKPFQEKTQWGGEVTSLSFSIWKYGYGYNKVMVVARGLLQYTCPLFFLYFIPFLAIFS